MICGYCQIVWEDIRGITNLRANPAEYISTHCPNGGCDPEVFEFLDEETGHVTASAREKYRNTTALWREHGAPRGEVAVRQHTPARRRPRRQVVEEVEAVEAEAEIVLVW